MKRLTSLLALAAALAASAAPRAAAQPATTVVAGEAGGAHYLFAVPPGWNGDLVIWNHGFSLAPVGPVTDLGPLAAVQLAEGYAVAASSYSQTGWAVFKTRNDLQAMVGAFRERFGVPRQVFVTGASLGGIVTVQAVEEASLGNVVGAFSLCGAVGGSRNWDGALDLRLIYDAVCGAVPGAAIPGGAGGLPPDLPYSSAQLALAVDACTGVRLPPALRTAEQSSRLATILGAAQLPETFLVTDMGFATFGLRDLVFDATKLAGKIGAGNLGVDYGDPALNAAIARVAPNPGAANRLRKRYTPTGAVGTAKIVSIHTDKDGLVLVENESEYAKVAPPWQFTSAIVVEAVPTHCGFTGAEVVAGWESLRAWVAGGPQPTPAAIQGRCTALAPFFGGPCR
ncbi:MAG TPA: hypothetical protein VLI67_06045, partial [Vicinamibacteria bacterium]|nr:hypothetical protein [Vicinamibacteria bacterium]